MGQVSKRCYAFCGEFVSSVFKKYFFQVEHGGGNHLDPIVGDEQVNLTPDRKVAQTWGFLCDHLQESVRNGEAHTQFKFPKCLAMTLQKTCHKLGCMATIADLESNETDVRIV